MDNSFAVKYKKELEFSGPFYISFESFGAAPCGQIDRPALANAFALWLDARGILPEITGWSRLSGFSSADAAGYAAKYGCAPAALKAALDELEAAIWASFCKESVWDACIYDSQMPDEG